MLNKLNIGTHVISNDEEDDVIRKMNFSKKIIINLSQLIFCCIVLNHTTYLAIIDAIVDEYILCLLLSHIKMNLTIEI